MKREVTGEELQNLLEAIKSSDVVETRVQLISELGELDVSEETEQISLLESLTDWIFWEDFTCLDITQCMLNKTILHVAANYLEADASRCLGQVLALGTKASIWCEKHLKMTLMSTEESPEEEHHSLFFQLLLDVLSYSAASFSALARYPVATSKELMVIVEKSILELLNLTKDSISEVKRIHPLGPEVLKAAQVVLGAAICLCKVYCNGINWDLHNSRTEKDASNKGCNIADDVNHVVNITRCTVEKLCELGVLAANDGGSLVSVLNMAWKGVVSLLQLGKGNLAVKLNVADIILTLISLANGALRCAALTWSSSLMEIVPATEARRIFLPVKFFLINAVRIISHYPIQAFSVYKDIALCIIMISTFRISLGLEDLLKLASEALAELLEPTSFHLLNSLLSSAQVKGVHKFQILDWLFSDGTDPNFISADACSNFRTNSMDAIFSVSCDSMPASRILLIGQVHLFVNLLKSAPDLEDDVRLGIAKKLEWLFYILTEENIYSFVLVLPVTILHGTGQAQEVAYESMFSSILRALKTFMIVVSSTPAWKETELFLLENLFHPHPLCWEMIMELWCFMIRHSEIDLVNDIIDKLCSLLRTVTSAESVFIPSSALRKIARSICLVVTCGSQSLADQVFSFIFGTYGSELSSTMFIALLVEGFPLSSLSDKVKSVAQQRIVTEYRDFLDRFDDGSLRKCAYGVFGAPVFALSAALQSLQVSISDTELKTLNLLVAIIRKYTNCEDNSERYQYLRLLGETLWIISSMKHLYACDEMEKVILNLEKLFISESASSDSELFRCKPNLASFMSGLAHVDFEETDSNAKSSAAWALFHMLLRERHWAFSHLAITAFGYFSARTNCKELWRYVPPDAALSFDLESGKEANEERFMSEFKVFLEKEMACIKLTPTSDELALLVKDGVLLKDIVQKISSVDTEAIREIDIMEVHDEKQACKRRKLPDGISKGVELLQSGLKVIANGLSLWQQTQLDSEELHGKFLTHFSRLEDEVANLVSLADK